MTSGIEIANVLHKGAIRESYSIHGSLTASTNDFATRLLDCRLPLLLVIFL